MQYYVTYENDRFILKSCFLMVLGPQTFETVEEAKNDCREKLVSHIKELEEGLKETKEALELFDKTAENLQLKG